MIQSNEAQQKQQAQQSVRGANTGNSGADMACGQQEAPQTIRASIDIQATYGFENALSAVKNGGTRATRAGWNAPGQYIEAQHRDSHSRMSVPYLVLKNAQGQLVPWVPSQGDLFARDWAILPR